MLRRAGLPVGTADGLLAARAIGLLGLSERETLRAALRASFVRRREHAEVFDAAFDLFWRDPSAPAREAGAEEAPPRLPPAARRAAEAMGAVAAARIEEAPPREDAALSASERERLGRMDFEAMSATQLAEARRAARRMAASLARRPTRRFRPDPRGPRADLRATLRTARRRGGEVATLERRRRVSRPPPLVMLCDVSGSMARYAQVLLHFLHALANGRERVHGFVFGTRLTNVTRTLRHRDPEVAFEALARLLPDWSGGTRIGESLERFNRLWARRVLGGGAVVVLVTDGLDRAGAEGVSEAAERLARSCRRLVWLNPLLRYDGFEPRAAGVRALLPHVHEHRPVHNLDSLRALSESLTAPDREGRR